MQHENGWFVDEVNSRNDHISVHSNRYHCNVLALLNYGEETKIHTLTCSWRNLMYSIASKRTEAVSVCSKGEELGKENYLENVNRLMDEVSIQWINYTFFLTYPRKSRCVEWSTVINFWKSHAKTQNFPFYCTYLPIWWDKLLKSRNPFAKFLFLFLFQWAVVNMDGNTWNALNFVN